jgi:type II secretory pathway pseudopilin PulG
MKFHSKHRQQGFTLMNLLLSLGLVATVALALAAIAGSSSSFLSNMDQMARINDTMDEMLNGLSIDGQCKKNFLNVGLSATPPVESQVNKVSFFDPSGIPHDILALNQVLPGIAVKDLRLVPGPEINSSVVAASLQVTFQKSSTDGGQTIRRSIPIFAVTQAKKLVDCWVRKVNPSIVYDQICLTSSGQVLDKFDPIANECTVTNGRWVPGTSTAASCPGGAYVAPSNASSLSHCRVQLPSGWSDPAIGTAPPIPFTNGYSSTGLRSPFLLVLNKAANSCQCYWATDIPAANTTGATCQVLCVFP